MGYHRLDKKMLRRMRREAGEAGLGLTLADLSACSGLSASYISKLERGIKGNAALLSLQKFAKGCGGRIEINFLKDDNGVERQYRLLG